MRSAREICRELRASLPDVPRWVHTRALLADPRSELFLCSHGAGYVVVAADRKLASVVGQPSTQSVVSATEVLEHDAELLSSSATAPGLAAMLPNWQYEIALLHAWPEPAAAVLERAAPLGATVELCRQLDQELLRDWPLHLQAEKLLALDKGPWAVAWMEGRPVSLVYADSITERLWDVSADTLPAFRRRGLAAACFLALSAYYVGHARAPVWGAVESNLASRRVALRLGMIEVDRLAVFERAAAGRQESGTSAKEFLDRSAETAVDCGE